MRKTITTFCILLIAIYNTTAQLPKQKEILCTLEKVNGYFMNKYPDPGQDTYVGGRYRTSNLWTRAVYYEGLIALYRISPKDEYFKYIYNWGESHKWKPRYGNTTRNADDYCCCQTYIDMYRITHNWNMIQNAIVNASMITDTPQNDDWWWIDAIQMGMPVMAKLGKETGDKKFFRKMWQMYSHTRNVEGGGLFNAKEGLWWRDRDFVPPYKEPNGKNCYWSRGNGWVYAALVRVIGEIPSDEPHYRDYVNDFKKMSKAIKACIRDDGFWNVSMHDENNFGGKETSGTSLFIYGMAWGIRNGLLNRNEYMPVIERAWNAVSRDCVHQDTGMLGYVQGTGKQPSDSQPVGYDIKPNFEDYGIGCFLLAGTEVYKLADK